MAKITRKQKHTLHLGKMVGVGLFSLLLIVGFVTGLAWFARPAVSAFENRNLTPFPAVSFSGLWDGSWFSQVSTWYADTYPGRESLVADANTLKKMYGISYGPQVYGNLNTAGADEIPDDSSQEDSPAKPEVNRAEYSQTEIPENYDVSQDVQNQIMQGQLILNGSAYGLYYYVDEAARAYASALNEAAKELDGTTQIFSVLVPNNSGVMLDEEILNGTGGSNQQQAISHIYSLYDQAVVPVPTIETLREHNDEYLYFHGDHHWTSLGAYYAYVNFCKAKNIEPMELDEWQSETFEPFMGSYRSISSDLTEDYVTGYVPNSTNTTKIFDTQGEYVPLDLDNTYTEGAVFNTSEAIDAYGQYLRFINGDRGLQEIDNPDLNDGSSCVVVKESYGNAFVPFLVDHYDKVYVIDYRYADGSIVDFCREHDIDDLIFVNNIQIIGSTDVVASIDQMLQPASSSSNAVQNSSGSEGGEDPAAEDSSDQQNPADSSDSNSADA